MAFLDFFRTAPAPTRAPVTDIPAGTSHIARTQGGAHVAVHPHVLVGREGHRAEGTAWTCLGCDTVGNESWAVGPPASIRPSTYRQDTIRAANTHAADCYFGPKPTSSGRPTP